MQQKNCFSLRPEFRESRCAYRTVASIYTIMHLFKVIKILLSLVSPLSATCRLKLRGEETRLNQVMDDVKSKWSASGFLLCNAIAKINLRLPEVQILRGNIVKRFTIDCSVILIDTRKVKPSRYKAKRYTKFCKCSCNNFFHNYQLIAPNFAATENYPKLSTCFRPTQLQETQYKQWQGTFHFSIVILRTLPTRQNY